MLPAWTDTRANARFRRRLKHRWQDRGCFIYCYSRFGFYITNRIFIEASSLGGVKEWKIRLPPIRMGKRISRLLTRMQNRREAKILF